MRLVLTTFCLLVLVPVSSFASSDEQLQECIGALNAIAQEIDRDRPHLNSEYVRALYGSVLMDRALTNQATMDSKMIGDARDIRNCFAVDIDKKHLELLLKAYNGQLSTDPAEDLAYCYAVILSFEIELEIALGKNVGGQIATLLGENFGNVFAFVTRLYREPEVWEIEQRAAQIREKETAAKLAESRYICELYSVPISAMTIAAITSVRASSQTGINRMAPNSTKKQEKRGTPPNCDELPSAGDYAEIILRFSGDSWTEISDVNGNRLFFDLGKAGRIVELAGPVPISVLVGNSDYVGMSVNGEECLISPSTSGSRAARFTLQ